MRALLHRLRGQATHTDRSRTGRLAPFSRAARRSLRSLALAGFTLALAAILLPHRVILQGRAVHSVPFTLGVRVAAPPRWQPGELVAFRTRDLRPYYPAGTLFTKVVAGVPGDRLVRLGRDFYVNGRYIATARETDAHGRMARLFTPPRILAPVSTGLAWNGPCREARDSRVPDGALFVLGTHERSFDSRYWGFVTHTEVVGRVVALF